MGTGLGNLKLYLLHGYGTRQPKLYLLDGYGIRQPKLALPHGYGTRPVPYTHLRAQETLRYLVFRLLLEKKIYKSRGIAWTEVRLSVESKSREIENETHTER